MNKIIQPDRFSSLIEGKRLTKTPRLPVTIILDNIRSLYNVGSIFRTSDAAGVEKLYLCGITGSPPRAEIHKAALGAEKIVPWEYISDSISIVADLKSRGYSIVALEHTDSGVNYDAFTYNFPLCLIIGHEITGVSNDLIKYADAAIEIPMSGVKQSLNVSVAYGIAVFEIVKNYNQVSEMRAINSKIDS